MDGTNVVTLVKLRRTPPERFNHLGLVPIKRGYWKIELLSNDSPLTTFAEEFLIKRRDWIEKYMVELMEFIKDYREKITVIGGNKIKWKLLESGFKLMGVFDTRIPFEPYINYFYLVLIKTALYDDVFQNIQLIQLGDERVLMPINIEHTPAYGGESLLWFKTENPYSHGFQKFPPLRYILREHPKSRKYIQMRSGRYVQVKPEFLKFIIMNIGRYMQNGDRFYFILPGFTPAVKIIAGRGIVKNVDIVFDKENLSRIISTGAIKNDFSLELNLSIPTISTKNVSAKLTLTENDVNLYTRKCIISG